MDNDFEYDYPYWARDKYHNLTRSELARLSYGGYVWDDWDLFPDGMPFILGFRGNIYDLGDLVCRLMSDGDTEMLLRHINAHGIYLLCDDFDSRFEIVSDGEWRDIPDYDPRRCADALQRFQAAVNHELRVLAAELSKKVCLAELAERYNRA